MKKTLAAAAVLATIGHGAWAQSTVTVYGLADAGLSYESGSKAGSITKVVGGLSSGSRLGFKGTEDLGSGNFALFVLESGVQLDTGVSGQGGVLFGRQAFVGIGNKQAGTLTFGRQYSPEYLAAVFADPFSSGTSADEKNLINPAGNGGRLDNSVKYASPVANGFSAELVYAAGEIAGHNQAGRSLGFGVGYAAGPLDVRLAYHNKNNDTATASNSSARNTLLAATYDLKVAKLYAAYGLNKGLGSTVLRNTANPYGYAVAPVATTDSTDALLGVSVPFGPHTLLASWIHKNDRMAANRDANQLAVGYKYALSKRTNLYAVYARMLNKNGAGYTLGNASDGGTGDRAVNLGIRHAF